MAQSGYRHHQGRSPPATFHPFRVSGNNIAPFAGITAGIADGAPYAPQTTVEVGGSVLAMQQRVQSDTAGNKSVNTAKAYGPKLLEFSGFCNHFYHDDGAGLARLVTEDKLYKFLFYQAYREQRKKGCKKNGESVDDKFDPNDYNSVVNSDTATLERTTPTKPIGISLLVQHLNAIMNLLKQQREEENVNTRRDDQVKTSKVNALVQHVQLRKVAVNRACHVEKLDKELLPYVNLVEYPKMEQELWDSSNSTGGYKALIGLRNRDCLLTTKSAILRGESLFYGELSDCLDVIHDSQTGDPTPYHVAIQQIDSGKTHRLHKGHVSKCAHCLPLPSAILSIALKSVYYFRKCLAVPYVTKSQSCVLLVPVAFTCCTASSY